MSLRRAPSVLDGVRYGAIARFEDPRGSFREIWKASTFGAIDPNAAGAPAGSTPRFVQAGRRPAGVGVDVAERRRLPDLAKGSSRVLEPGDGAVADTIQHRRWALQAHCRLQARSRIGA